MYLCLKTKAIEVYFTHNLLESLFLILNDGEREHSSCLSVIMCYVPWTLIQ